MRAPAHVPLFEQGLDRAFINAAGNQLMTDYAKPSGRRISSKHDHALNLTEPDESWILGCLFLNIYLNRDGPFDSSEPPFKLSYYDGMLV